MSVVLGRSTVYRCPWFDVVEKQVDLGGARGVEPFFGLRTIDYVAGLAVTEDGRIPLVRQFRWPIVEQPVLELPSGGVEQGEEPVDAMRRELLEETGCEAGEAVLLGRFHTDSGRLENSQWAYFLPGVRNVAEPSAEEELELEFVTAGELHALVERGDFRHALHLGVLGAALARGLIRL